MLVAITIYRYNYSICLVGWTAAKQAKYYYRTLNLVVQKIPSIGYLPAAKRCVPNYLMINYYVDQVVVELFVELLVHLADSLASAKEKERKQMEINRYTSNHNQDELMLIYSVSPTPFCKISCFLIWRSSKIFRLFISWKQKEFSINF